MHSVFPFVEVNRYIPLKTMKPRILTGLVIGAAFLILSGCSGNNGLIPKTRCHTAVAIATQTWEVTYFINKTSGGLNTQRIQTFRNNTITNVNGEKPMDAVSGPDDNGVWWGTIPPRPTADEVDQRRDLQEFNDPPQLQRSVDYQLRCEDRTLSTDALTYREAARAIRAGQAVSVSYVWNRAIKIEVVELDGTRKNPRVLANYGSAISSRTEKKGYIQSLMQQDS